MPVKGTETDLGLYLKRLLKERSLSMRKLSELTDIDTATISRIINGKRKATPDHLQKFAEHLGVPFSELFALAGYPMEEKVQQSSEKFTTVESIQFLLESTNLIDGEFNIESVEQHLAKYEQYVQTEEGTENILKNFGEKIKKLGSVGPFINQIKGMYEKFITKNGTPRELVLIGSALIYFIISTDVIPDYFLPLGYIDDAIAIQIVMKWLSIKTL
ncbi:helix-turn-helix domain-containing protein [Bacillus sp. ISL-18]|uniref:helix-turn-helix domain-containing protein n=1 Tax=Bacillus sp. ISL-18 TaxID=2819118 RepID=UPI001BEC5203|nr:helix-turn-helix domain-containing protein [Bacillus sp. ISL-18]MBT2655839.1 helix-turn-helix domain-containing protein [Bacillus sp. ISL-18]